MTPARTPRAMALGFAGVVGIVGIVGSFVYWRLSYFMRDPERSAPPGEDQIVAAADGYVTYVKRVESGQVPVAIKGRRTIALSEYAGVDSAASGYLVGTYMTELSVHRNRAPISGEIVLREHRSGSPFNYSMVRMAMNLMVGRTPYDEGCEYLLANERLTIAVRHRCGAVVFVTQIADVWISRIVARVSVGDQVQRGAQYGLIRFGSQCDVFLPDKLIGGVLVRPGQYVLAGETVLATAWPELAPTSGASAAHPGGVES